MSPRRLGAHELLDLVLDTASFRSWDSTPIDVGADPAYAAALVAALEKSGVDEAIITGEGLLRGRRVPSWQVNSPSWPEASGSPPPTGSRAPSSGPPPRGFRSWRHP